MQDSKFKSPSLNREILSGSPPSQLFDVSPHQSISIHALMRILQSTGTQPGSEDDDDEYVEVRNSIVVSVKHFSPRRRLLALTWRRRMGGSLLVRMASYHCG